jgi:hypothetical protein
MYHEVIESHLVTFTDAGGIMNGVFDLDLVKKIFGGVVVLVYKKVRGGEFVVVMEDRNRLSLPAGVAKNDESALLKCLQHAGEFGKRMFEEILPGAKLVRRDFSGWMQAEGEVGVMEAPSRWEEATNVV